MVDPLWAKALLDPSVLAGMGPLRDKTIRALLGYGDASSIFARPAGVDPSTGQPYQTIAEQYGIDENAVSGAATNPYSTLSGLRQQLTTDRHNITNTAAAHNAEFSGAHVAAQMKENADAEQRNYNAQQGLASTMGEIGSQRTGIVSGAYQAMMGRAATDPTIPAAPAEPAAPAAAAAPPIATAAPPPVNGLGQPWVDPGARENLVQPPPAPAPNVVAANLIKKQAARGFIGHA